MEKRWYDAQGRQEGAMRKMVLGVVIAAMCVVLAGTKVAAAEAKADTDTAPLRVAIVGLVHGHAWGFLTSAAKRTDIQIVGISEPDRKLFDQYAAKFGLAAGLYHADAEEMLATTKPQAALVYTNTFEHRKIVEICAKHHIPVMMEKPLAVNREDALGIEKAAHEGKIQVLVNYWVDWVPSTHTLFDVVHAGEIGDVRKIVSHFGHQGPKEIGVGPEFLGWLTDPKLNGGGALYDFGCYGADLATWLMDGQRPLTVTAITQQFKPEVYPKVDDEATIVLTYPKAQAILQASWNWAYGREDTEVYGNEGYVITAGADKVRERRPKEEEQMVAAKKVAAPYDDELTYLRAVILDGAKPDGISSLETNVIVAEIMDAARESAATWKAVRMKP
jgi:predicted dehydrogenase